MRDELHAIAVMVQSIDRSIARKEKILARLHPHDQDELRYEIASSKKHRQKLINRGWYLKSRPVRIEGNDDGQDYSETAAD